mgnify:CR=1 FL=1|jgi:CRISPR-associated protein Csx3
MTPIQPPIELTILHQTATGLSYQHLHIHITTPDGLIEPSDLKGLTLPDSMIWSLGVVIEGRAPIWLYGYLVHACHPALWVACFDPRLGDPVAQSGGAVVVSTHTHTVEVGEVLSVTLPDRLQERNP